VIILLSEAALTDLHRLRSFIEEKDATSAKRAADKLLSAIASLQDFPNRGRSAPSLGLRELIVPFGRPAYIVRYRYSGEPEEVTILRVWHNREDRE
jgi:plasmid stabilization system protein ParE